MYGLMEADDRYPFHFSVPVFATLRFSCHYQPTLQMERTKTFIEATTTAC